MRPQAALTIPITVIRDGPKALPEQIADQVRAAVEGGVLAPHVQLPSTRALAALLGVSRGVAVAAYELLLSRGYLHSQRGSGTFTASGPRPAGTRLNLKQSIVDLRPGQPNTEVFPLPAWRAAWRNASFRRPPTQPPPPLGLPHLRRAVAEHVWRTRGIPLAGREVVITGGAAHGLRIVLDLLGLPGSSVAVEEPCPPALHRAAGAATPLPLDAQGARVDGIPAHCSAIVVSADGQAPYGHIMSSARRRAAAGWASGRGGRVIEIAGDAVFRPECDGLPRLTTLAGSRSVLVGGFCELLTPALRLGYALVPPELVAAAERRIGDRAEQPPYLTQLAVASLLDDGSIVRQMHRLGRVYAAKRRIADSVLGPVCHARDSWPGTLGSGGGPALVGGASGPGGGPAVVGGPVGGASVVGAGGGGVRGAAGRGGVNTRVIELPGGDADRVAGELLRRGVRVDTLAPYHFSGRDVPPALVLGIGHLPDAQLRRTLGVVARVLKR